MRYPYRLRTNKRLLLFMLLAGPPDGALDPGFDGDSRQTTDIQVRDRGTLHQHPLRPKAP